MKTGSPKQVRCKRSWPRSKQNTEKWRERPGESSKNRKFELNNHFPQVEESREMNQNLVDTKERLNEEQQSLTAKLETLLADNK